MNGKLWLNSDILRTFVIYFVFSIPPIFAFPRLSGEFFCSDHKDTKNYPIDNQYIRFSLIIYDYPYNNDTRQILRKQIDPNKVVTLKTDAENKLYKKYLAPCRKYLKGVLREMTENTIEENGHKNMIVCSENDIRVSKEDKNKFIAEFYGNVNEVFTEKNLIMSHNLDADEVRSQLREHRKEGQNVLIDNLFIFYTNNDKVNSMEATALERWNSAYHVGLRNCFVFYFSEHPFRLNHIWRKGVSLSKRFPMITEKEFSNYGHFITFDESETNYLFDLKNSYEHKIIPDDQLMFTDVIGSLLDESEYRIQERNRFALCLSPELETIFKKYLKELYGGFDEENYQLSFDWQKDTNAAGVNSVLSKSVSSIKDYKKEIAVVVDKSTSKETKQSLTLLFQSFNPDVGVKFYDYSALKPTKGASNNIKENVVVVLQYRPHYTRQLFAKYPNSFDPIPVRPGQYIYDIIQGFVFDDMYKWDRYDYDKVMCELLGGEVRQKLFGKLRQPVKPDVRRVNGETEFSDERSTSRGIIYVRGLYENGLTFSLPESSYVICEIEGDTMISRLSDLKRQGLLSSVVKMQELDEIADELKTIIEKKTQAEDVREKFVRQTQFNLGKITEQERDSDTALWKILLAKRIEAEGVEQAYNAVMEGLKDNDRIQIYQFKKWADYENNMILPLLKVCQRKLFEYLGFGLTSPYLAIMRRKKLAATNGTRQYNSMTTYFLQQTLLAEIDDDVYDTFQNSEINELLMLQNKGDLSALVSLLREKIKFQTVKTIE
ncbi:MAG: hypothetical protein IKH61_14245 [Bacteroidales bacterium]|nr:hypothetical protein [Bacteroidales bacterium]